MSMHRMTTVSRLALGACMLASIARDGEDESGLSIIELDGSLSDAEKPPVLPAGNYTGEIQDVQVATSQKGNEYFNVKFVIAQDQVPAELSDDFEDGAILYWNRVIKPKKGDRRALWNLRKFIEALGLDSNTTTIDPNDWMGQQARLKVRNTKYEGEDRAEIASVESAEAPSRKTAAAAPKEAAAPAKKAAARGRK